MPAKISVSDPPKKAEKPLKRAKPLPTKPPDPPELPPDPVKTDLSELPRPPGFKLAPDKFFRYWSNLTPPQRERVLVYVYRLYPIIDRSRTGNPSNIAKLNEPFEARLSHMSQLKKRGSGPSWRPRVVGHFAQFGWSMLRCRLPKSFSQRHS